MTFSPPRPPGAPPRPAAWQPLRIVARGMCCAVGHTAPAATAAIEARMNHFRETQFVSHGGVPIVGGTLFDVAAWGAERMCHMLAAVIAEALAGAGQHAADTGRIALVLLVAEPSRPGGATAGLAEALKELTAALEAQDVRFHAGSCTLALGKAGIGQALETCAALLAAEQGPDKVLLAGVDCLLDAGAIGHFLDNERVATHANADGFIPAEGAAALLLARAALPGAGLCIDAVATAPEPWRMDSDIPVRAEGLTQAIRAAVHAAGCAVADLDFHASGMTGESWYAREATMALSRCLERRKTEFPHLIVARSTGETGAASALLTLAWLAGVLGSQAAPGPAGLLHFAGDDGQRAALVVHYRQASGPSDR